MPWGTHAWRGGARDRKRALLLSTFSFFPFCSRAPLSLSLSFRREAALSSIKLVDADIAVVMEAADLGRPAAERALREAGGKLEGALDRLARP